MKCLSSFILFALLSISTVFSLPSSYTKNGLKYKLSGKGTATLYDLTSETVEEITIPASIEYKKKYYRVTEIAANTFTGKDVSKITFDEKISGIVVKKNAFFEMRLNREININSKYVTAEIGGFDGFSKYGNFQGVGVPNLVKNYSKKLLRKWGLPVGKNYKNVSDNERMHDLFTLGKKTQETFGLYEKISGPSNAANIMFIGYGGSNGISRVYRILALTMGIPKDEVLVGSDNIYKNWVYVKINKGNGLKWYAFNIVDDMIDSNTSFDDRYFLTNKALVIELQKFYGEYYNIQGSDFIIYTNLYNYPDETQNPYSEYRVFEDWLREHNDDLA